MHIWVAKIESDYLSAFCENANKYDIIINSSRHIFWVNSLTNAVQLDTNSTKIIDVYPQGNISENI